VENGFQNADYVTLKTNKSRSCRAGFGTRSLRLSALELQGAVVALLKSMPAIIGLRKPAEFAGDFFSIEPGLGDQREYGLH